MILETGLASRPRSQAGFTLLEILLVFALITLASGVIITNFTTFLNFDEQINPEDSLRTAIRSARFQAASERSVTTLSYDDEAGALVVSGGESFQLNSNFGKEGRGEIRFYLLPPAEGMGRLPDAETSRLETKKLSFAPDRSSSPFAVEIDTGEGSAQRLIFDPFSSLVRSPK
jgi:type II secretory pathway pseudopilin PulG